jgi:S1-C subfamily serine protease
MIRRTATVLLAAVLVAMAVGLPATAARADDAGDTAREVLKKHTDSVLWVHAVIKMQATADGRKLPVPEESKVDLLGTVIGDDGLMVVSNTRLDPASAYDGRTTTTRTGQRLKIQATSEVQELKIRMSDGDEVPGKVILTDPDLDLAFIRIDTDSEEFEGKSVNAIDLDKAAKAKSADRVFTVSRLGKVVNYAAMVKFTRILAVVEKPRRFYVSDGVRIGCPAFNEKGKLIGVAVFRRTAKSAEDNQSIPVVLPAADVAEIAKQAKPRDDDQDKPDDEKGTAEKVGSAVKGAATTAAKATAGAAKKAASATVDVVTGDDDDDDDDDDDEEDDD